LAEGEAGLMVQLGLAALAIGGLLIGVPHRRHT
jgi:hypothetical protein